MKAFWALLRPVVNYELKWAEETGWAMVQAFAVAFVMTYWSGNGLEDRSTLLATALAAGSRPALAILAQRLKATVDAFATWAARSGRETVQVEHQVYVAPPPPPGWAWNSVTDQWVRVPDDVPVPDPAHLSPAIGEPSQPS